jgi:hypothetical protein
LFTVNVPLPDPLVLLQDDHVTAEMDMCPSQPMSIRVGSIWGFKPGVHDATVGAGEAGLAGEAAFVVADREDIGVVAASVTTLLVVGEYGEELMTHPTPKPTARAARRTAPTPIRTTVLRRNAITAPFLSAREGDSGFGALRGRAWNGRLRERRKEEVFNFHPTRNPAVTPRPVQCRQSW